jgi:Flagellar biosynthesis protein, FliO
VTIQLSVERGTFIALEDGWCERGDLNPHGFPRQILSLVRLPIPPLSRPPALRAEAAFRVTSVGAGIAFSYSAPRMDRASRFSRCLVWGRPSRPSSLRQSKIAQQVDGRPIGPGRRVQIVRPSRRLQVLSGEPDIRRLATKDETPRRPTDSGKNDQNIQIDFAVDPNASI